MAISIRTSDAGAANTTATVPPSDAPWPFLERGDDVAAFQWLEREVPHYRSVVQQEPAVLVCWLQQHARAVLRTTLPGERPVERKAERGAVSA